MTNHEPADGVSNVSKMTNKKAGGPKPVEAHSILSEDGRTAFDLIWNQGRMAWIRYTQGGRQEVLGEQEITVDGRVYSTPTESLRGLTSDELFLASGIGGRASPLDLFYRMKRLLAQAVYLPGGDQDVVALFLSSTFKYDFYSALNYVAFVGEKGTGKSTALQACAKLGFNSVLGSGADSDATVPRIIDLIPGTLCTDELQGNLSDNKASLHKVFTTGNQRRGGAKRLCEVDKRTGKISVRSFKAFCPKVGAGIYLAGDAAILSRIYQIEMQARSVEELNLFVLDDPKWNQEAEQLKNDLLLERQRRRVGEIAAPALHYRDILRRHSWTDPRDFQIYDWLFKESPTLEILERAVIAISAQKRRAGEARADEADAETLYIVHHLLQEKLKPSSSAERSITLERIRQRMEGAGHRGFNIRFVPSILRRVGIKIKREGSGRYIEATEDNLRLVEKYLKRMGVTPVVSSHSASSSFATPAKATSFTSVKYEDEIPFEGK